MSTKSEANGRIWIVCPTYLDVPAFGILHSRVLEILRIQNEDVAQTVEFVVVDDTGGFDPDVTQLAGFDDVLLVTTPFNVGHQRAIVCGLRFVLPQLRDSDIVVTMDADGEDRPEDLPRLIAPLLEDRSRLGTVCVARRTKRTEPLTFRMMYVMFRLMFRVLTGETVRNGNYAAYRGALAKRILLHPYFDLCYSSTLISLNLPVTPVPCPRGHRYAGKSRMNTLKLLMHGFRMLMPFTGRLAVRSLAAFSCIFGVGLLLAITVVCVKVFTSAAIPGWSTSTLLGVLILALVSLGNFVVLFAVFSHSRGVSLVELESWSVGTARETSSTSD